MEPKANNDWRQRTAKKDMQKTGAEIVIECLKEQGVDTVFGYPGGAILNVYDELYKHSDEIRHILTSHEQGASHAADGYARSTGKVGVCFATSGPGATNAITGLCGAYMDSIPVIFISGQAKRADLVGDQNIRQFGIQEVDIISMVKPYAKYAVRIMDETKVRYELEKAAYLAASGRPGAVWIDIPLDIQAMNIEPESLEGYKTDDSLPIVSDETINAVIEAYNKSSRPAVILGNGVRLSHASGKARELIELLGAPAFVSWNGVDLLEEDHPLYFGRPNIVGHRSANLILQNADFVLSIGTRLSLLNTGYNFGGYLKNAYHVMVDIDENEMNKKSLHPQMKVVADALDFIDAVLGHKDSIADKALSSWIDHCKEMKAKYPVEIPEQQPRDGFVSLYKLFDAISDEMTSDDVYQFTSSGTSVDIGMKVLRLKKGQRAFLNKSMAAMGYDVPASIGSCIGSGGKRVICVTGDGSIAMNMQELEIMKRLNLPVKIFVADNSGYSMIWHSQNGNFNGHLTGCTEESGLSLPDMKRIAEAFGICGMEITDENDLSKTVKAVFDHEGPVICRVKTDIMQKVLPKQSNFMNEKGQMESRPLQDMFPLLDRDELEGCMNWQ